MGFLLIDQLLGCYINGKKGEAVCKVFVILAPYYHCTDLCCTSLCVCVCV